MKKTILIICCGFIITTAFIKPPTDYRDTFVGNYVCTSTCKTVKSDLSGYDINTKTITIRVAKNTLDSILDITLSQNTYTVKLKNNYMSPYLLNRQLRGDFFSTDSISFSLFGTMDISGCSYKGKKQ